MPFTLLAPEYAAPAPATTLGAPKTSVGMTLSSMTNELDALLGRRADVDTERFELWLNLAYVDLCTSLNIDELKGSLGIELEEGQAHYMLPEIVDTIIGASLVLPSSVNRLGGYPLDKMDLATYRSLADDDDEPRIFFRHTDMLVVWPTPSAARTLALDIRIRPQWMAESTDSPILGTEWHEGILLGARQRGFSALMEYDKAAAAQNEYIGFVRRRTDREAKEQEGRVIGSAAPHKLEQIRNRVIQRGPYRRGDT